MVRVADAVRSYAGTVTGGRVLKVDGPALTPRRRQSRGRSGVTGSTNFEGATFEAKLHEMKALPTGEWRIVLLIPDTDGEEGVKLRDAYSCGLHVDITKKSYDGAE